MAPRPSFITMNNAIGKHNSNGMDDDVINSLGKVLSSVNLVGEEYGGGSGGQQQSGQGQPQQGRQPGSYYVSNSWNGAPVPSAGSSSSG